MANLLEAVKVFYDVPERVVHHDGNVRRSVGTACTIEEGKTRQSDAKAADVNKIVARFDFESLNAEFQRRLASGEPPWIGVDVSQVPTFQEAIALVRRTEEYFMKLPPDIRAKFGYDPARMVDCFNSPELRGEFGDVFRVMGILEPDAEAAEDRKEAKAEARAEKRREARELAKRVEAAKQPPVEPKA